jgi:hypothetical protein
MTTVFIEARPKGRREGTAAIVDYVVEKQGDLSWTPDLGPLAKV